MQNFLRKHINSFLAALALAFIAVIAAYFVWGIGFLISQINAATVVNPNGNGASAAFNLKDAAKIDYRGTLQQ